MKKINLKTELFSSIAILMAWFIPSLFVDDSEKLKMRMIILLVLAIISLILMERRIYKLENQNEEN